MLETQKSDPVLSWRNLGLGVETNPVHICSWTEGCSGGRAIPQEDGTLRDELFWTGVGAMGTAGRENGLTKREKS